MYVYAAMSMTCLKMHEIPNTPANSVSGVSKNQRCKPTKLQRKQEAVRI